MAVSGSFAYLANHDDGLRIYDLTVPSSIVIDFIVLMGRLVFMATEMRALSRQTWTRNVKIFVTIQVRITKKSKIFLD